MPQVDRSTFSTKLNTLINDNNAQDVTAAEVREIFTDLEDSAVWFNEGVRRDQTTEVAVGYTTGGFDLGTVTSGTITPAFASGNMQTLTNGGAFTLAAPTTGWGTVLLQITNNASAGAITFSGFSSQTGSTLNTTNNNRFLLTIARFGTVSWVNILASSGNT